MPARRYVMVEDGEESSGQTIIRDAPLTVEKVFNHIYFYAGVDTDRVLALIKEIRYSDDDLRGEHITRWAGAQQRHPIWLHIQSYGGSLFAGLSAADQLGAIVTPVYSIAEGCVASAATLISVACDKRYILPGAFMLIHQLSSIYWGKYEEFEDEMHLLEMLMERLVTVYTQHTNMDEAKVKTLLKRDSWFNAEECVELGLVDEIITPDTFR